MKLPKLPKLPIDVTVDYKFLTLLAVYLMGLIHGWLLG